MKLNFIKCTALSAVIFLTSNLSAQEIELKNKEMGNNLTLIKRKAIVPATVEDKQVVAQAVNNLEFDFDKATIHTSSYKSLDGLADWLKARDFTLKISGHADYIGSDEYNLQLSNLRAQAVKTYLVEKGADPALIEPVGFGKTQPIASNGTDEGRQKNRRVEFTLY